MRTEQNEVPFCTHMDGQKLKSPTVRRDDGPSLMCCMKIVATLGTSWHRRQMDLTITHGPAMSSLVWCQKDSLVLVPVGMDIRMLRAHVFFSGKTEKT